MISGRAELEQDNWHNPGKNCGLDFLKDTVAATSEFACVEYANNKAFDSPNTNTFRQKGGCEISVDNVQSPEEYILNFSIARPFTCTGSLKSNEV